MRPPLRRQMQKANGVVVSYQARMDHQTAHKVPERVIDGIVNSFTVLDRHL